MPYAKETTIEERLSIIETKLSFVVESVKDIKITLSGEYATKEFVNNRFNELEPIKRIVYGAVGLILFTVLGALVALVINK